MHWQAHIEQNPAVMCGKPVIKGTRITVAHILELLGNGWSTVEVLESCPGVTADDIQAAYLHTDETIFFEGDSP